MSRTPKPTPLEAFDLNLQDAEWLIKTAKILSNQRTRRPRSERREAIGQVLRIPARHREGLDCIENEEIFLVIKPGASIDRSHVASLDPLLRQAIVAANAALETFVADVVIDRVGALIRRPEDLPSRLGKLHLTVGQWKEINDTYSVHRRGLRERVLIPAIKEASSTSPSQIGIVLSMIGITGWESKVDDLRRVKRGSTRTQLEALSSRRNRIAHEGDRRGQGRAPITIEEAGGFVRLADDVCHSISALIEAS